LPVGYNALYNPTANNWSYGPGSFGNGVNRITELPGGDLIVAGGSQNVGSLPINFIARYTAQTQSWSAMQGGVTTSNPFSNPPRVNAMLPLADGRVIVGGHFTIAGGAPAGNLAVYDPESDSWAALGQGISGPGYPEIRCIAQLPGGDFLVGGNFTSAGGAAVNHLARLNPTTGAGSPLAGAQPNGDVRQAVPAPGGDLIVTGDFTSIGGISASRIARYNPAANTWSALGSGISGSIPGGLGPYIASIVVLPGGDILAGGTFSTAGGNSIRNLARYSPAAGTWSALGVGMGVYFGSSCVNAITLLPSGDVILGGLFRLAVGMSVTNMVRLSPDSNTWSLVGSGTTGRVNAITPIADGRLLVGGTFSMIWNVPANYLALYDPVTLTFSSLGASTDGGVEALSRYQNGDVLVVGTFSSAGGVAAPAVARYSPSTGAWTGLGASTPGGVSNAYFSTAIALPNDDVVVGGSFTTIGGVPANYIARYSAATNTWAPIGTEFTTYVGSVLLLPDGDLLVWAGGVYRYDSAGGTWTRFTTGSGWVSDMLLLPDGDALIGGRFSETAGYPSAAIARFRPSTNEWLAVNGLGVNLSVDRMTLTPEGDVIACGFFEFIGGIQAKNIAVYHPTSGTWSSFHPGLTSALECLALPTGDILALGSLGVAGGPPLASFAHFAVPSSDYDHDGDYGTDLDIEAFFACLGGNCCPTCGSPDFDGDGDTGTDLDIESFFRVLGGGPC